MTMAEIFCTQAPQRRSSVGVGENVTARLSLVFASILLLYTIKDTGLLLCPHLSVRFLLFLIFILIFCSFLIQPALPNMAAPTPDITSSATVNAIPVDARAPATEGSEKGKGTGAELPWHAAFPPVRSMPDRVTKEEVLGWSRHGEKSASDYVLVDVRRMDHEVHLLHLPHHFPFEETPYRLPPSLIPLRNNISVSSPPSAGSSSHMN